ncbi:MAG: rhodanese-like domain-containing protein [Gemmatimonadetes bacterium]|nr:rhodanese-like domain-containing protein [Gemmatimonadota bacterium]
MRRLNLHQFKTVLAFALRLAMCTGVAASAQEESEDSTMSWSLTLKTIRAEFPTVAHISTDTLQSWLDESTKRENLLLFDVREPEEYAVSHLQGARPAPSKDEALKALQGVSSDHRIVLYCSVGHRSSELAQFLMKKGYTEIYNLEGSIFAWANEGRPVYRGKERVQVVHPYDRNWGRLLKESLQKQ